MPYYSIVLPVYNEEDNVGEVHKRVTKVLKSLKKDFELIFINDGSFDKTLKKLKKLQSTRPYIKIINFSRNYGHQAAVTAGMDYSSGEYIAVLDADLQDPPEVLPMFFAKLDEGYDVVYAIRRNRKEGILKKAAYSIFYRILRTISNIDIPLDTGDFCVMSKRVVTTMRKMPERNRFVRGIRSWVGFRQVGIEYERHERHGGQSKYTFHKLIKLAVDGMLSFSYIPLRIMTFGGMFAFLASIVGVFVTLYLRLFTKTFVPGFATTIILLMFTGGIIILGLGIIGEYIARIYDEVKQRPPYIVESLHGFEE
jgi:dolichol-phosphate mannosyltransferase